MTAVADKLREARALIERGWCQGDYQRKERGHTCFCALGALLKVGSPKETVRLVAGVAVKRSLYGTPAIRLIDWNDQPHRRKGQVLAAFDKAIDLASQEAAK